MSSHVCYDVERHLWRYIDRELPANEISAISAHLKRCRDCQQLYMDGAREANSYRTAFVNAPFGEPFVAKFRKRMAAEELLENGALAIGPGLGATNGPAPGRGLRRLLAVLAMVILIPLVLTVGMFYGRSSLGYFQTEGGKARLVRFDAENGDVGEELGRGEILGGDRFEVNSHVVVNLAVPTAAYTASSQLQLDGPGVFELADSSDSHYIAGRLESGVLYVDVAKDPLREEFRIETPHAVVRVLGTQFTLEVEPGATYLSVDEGRVELSSLGNTAALRVMTPESGVWGVLASGAFVSRVPDRLVVAPAPAAPEQVPTVDVAPESGTDVAPESGTDVAPESGTDDGSEGVESVAPSALPVPLRKLDQPAH